MKTLKIILYTVCSFLLFTSCKNESDTKKNKENEQYAEEDGYDADYKEPYPEYCLVGNVPNVDPYKLNSDDAILKTEGRNRTDINDPKTTSFSASLSNFKGLEKAGISSITIDVKAGRDKPKFKIGDFVLKPYAILNTEEKKLPEVMVFLHDFDQSSSFESVMQPDVEAIKKSAFYTPETYPSYIIVAASLNITHVEEIKLNKDELEQQKLQAEMGMITGKQYIKGFISFTIKKFGSKGADFGPQTFTFASVSDWAYFPDL